MELWLLLTISFSLAMDCFAVSLGIGSSPLPTTWRSTFRVAFHFGLFQFLMALLGWLLGSTIIDFIAGFDHWIALALLVWVGGRMIREGLSKEEEHDFHQDPSRGRELIMLSIATSIDSLGVGLSMALLKSGIITTGLWIGLASLILSMLGMQLGNQLSRHFGKGVEVLGGLILILIGLRIFLTHTLA